MRIYTFQLLSNLSQDPAGWSAWSLLSWLYRLPGSLFLEAVGNIPAVTQILPIQASAATGYSTLDGRIVNVLSLFFWAATALWILHSSSTPKATDTKAKEKKAPTWHHEESTKRQKHGVRLKTRYLN